MRIVLWNRISLINHIFINVIVRVRFTIWYTTRRQVRGGEFVKEENKQ